MKKTVSLNENRMFTRLYRQGKSHVTPYFVVYVKKNRQRNQVPRNKQQGMACPVTQAPRGEGNRTPQTSFNRLGITATKKIGNAVERNRAKRVIKEAYRLLEPELPTGIDIVIVARRKAVFSKMQTIMHALHALDL